MNIEADILSDYIDIHKKELIDNLINLVNIPSIKSESSDGMPYGKDVDKALSMAADLAESMGFKAANCGNYTEIKFGNKKIKGLKKIYVAGHLDVVPAGDGWTGDPWKATIRDGKIYGRGVLDNKGPSIAVLYAFKALKSMGFVPKADIRLILGGDEETGMSDMKAYIDKNGVPDFGLTPDSTFPIVNAELGVVFARVKFSVTEQDGDLVLESLQGGNAFNSVPDLCRAVLSIKTDRINELKALVSMADKDFDFDYSFTKNKLYIETKGVSAHGSTPEEGQNAVLLIVRIISMLMVSFNSRNSFIEFSLKYFMDDIRGESLGISCSDAVSGPLSLNVGMADYSGAGQTASWSVDLRVPVTVPTENICEKIRKATEKSNALFEIEKSDAATYIPADNEYLVKLASVYEDITGKKSRYIACRGATYAKSFRGTGVAFGPIDESDISAGGGLHSADEFISINSLLELSKIYALAIFRLWGKAEG